jgi:hypothetical protein
MPYIVIEEIWSAAFADEQRLLRSYARPLFAGLRQAAYEFAKQRASKYACHQFNEGAERAYWWGRNAGDHATYRFVIEPAQSRSRQRPVAEVREGSLRFRAAPRAPADLATKGTIGPSGNVDGSALGRTEASSLATALL